MSLNLASPLDFLTLFLRIFEDGRAFLSTGQYEYKFETKAPPKFVWIAEIGAGQMPVCQGGVNTFGVHLLDDGFVLKADVQSEFAEIRWQAVLIDPAIDPVA